MVLEAGEYLDNKATCDNDRFQFRPELLVTNIAFLHNSTDRQSPTEAVSGYSCSPVIVTDAHFTGGHMMHAQWYGNTFPWYLWYGTPGCIASVCHGMTHPIVAM